jgi:hypothetical protein
MDTATAGQTTARLPVTRPSGPFSV